MASQSLMMWCFEQEFFVFFIATRVVKELFVPGTIIWLFC